MRDTVKHGHLDQAGRTEGFVWVSASLPSPRTLPPAPLPPPPPTQLRWAAIAGRPKWNTLSRPLHSPSPSALASVRPPIFRRRGPIRWSRAPESPAMQSGHSSGRQEHMSSVTVAPGAALVVVGPRRERRRNCSRGGVEAPRPLPLFFLHAQNTAAARFHFGHGFRLRLFQQSNRPAAGRSLNAAQSTSQEKRRRRCSANSDSNLDAVVGNLSFSMLSICARQSVPRAS